MRKIITRFGAVALAAVALCAVQPGAFADDSNRKHRDRGRYQELREEWTNADRKHQVLLDRALGEARANDGRAKPATEARLQNVIEQRDRARAHLEDIAARYGWPLPERAAAVEADAGEADPLGGLVPRARSLVRDQLAKEARSIAGRLRLPVPPVVKPGKRARGAGREVARGR